MTMSYKAYIESIQIAKQDKEARLMMVCGCLHDIAENSKEIVTKRQLKDVQQILEKIITK